MRRLMKELEEIRADKVLDVATRYGEFAFKLRDGLQSYSEIVAIDNNPEIIREARELYPDYGITFKTAEGEHLAFADDSFDIVCISNSLHHIREIGTVLLEMKRVLKPGGLYIVNEMFSDNQSPARQTHVLLHHLGGEIDMLLGTYHRNTYTKEELVSLFRTVGLDHENIFEDYETDPVLAEEQVKEVARIVKKAEKAKGFPEYGELIRRAREVQEIYRKNGLTRCTQLVMMGRKTL